MINSIHKMELGENSMKLDGLKLLQRIGNNASFL
jgi:hypothetical protein